MTERRMHTERLELTPMSAEIIEALLHGRAERLRSLTQAEFPRPVAPPPYMAESLPEVVGRLIGQVLVL